MKCILQNEKYAGDSLMQKYYTSNHLEHDSTPNKELLVEQYYKEGTHDALVSRDVYEDANRVMMMRDLKRGPDQYPYYGRLLCPYCGKPMVKVNTGHGRIPAGWICGGDCKGELYEERSGCPIYCVKDPYLSEAVINAIMSLDDEREDARWVKEQIRKRPTVEFGYLKKLVKHITFDGWDILKIEWVWGEVTEVPFEVTRAADYPDLTLNGNRIGHFTLMLHTAFVRLRLRLRLLLTEINGMGESRRYTFVWLVLTGIFFVKKEENVIGEKVLAVHPVPVRQLRKWLHTGRNILIARLRR